LALSCNCDSKSYVVAYDVSQLGEEDTKLDALKRQCVNGAFPATIIDIDQNPNLNYDAENNSKIECDNEFYNYNKKFGNSKLHHNKARIEIDMCVDSNGAECVDFEDSSSTGILSFIYSVGSGLGLNSEDIFILEKGNEELHVLDDKKIDIDRTITEKYRIFDQYEHKKLTEWNDKLKTLHEQYDSKQEVHASTMAEAEAAIDKLKNATTKEEYLEAYKDWENNEEKLKTNGCVGPAPPPPIDKTPKPLAIDECHESYLLGYHLGEAIGTLVYDTHGSPEHIDNQQKCLDNYAEYQRIKNKGVNSIENICFERGKDESIKLQRRLLGNHVDRDEYEKIKAQYRGDTISQEVGRSKYYADLMN